MSRLYPIAFAAALAALLSGCVSYPEYHYVDRDGSGDYYYADPYYDERYPSYVDVSYGYWPAYYSVVWPVYHRYYDPWWSPGFYYGVTWFPRTYFGFGLAYHDAWPWYHHYSPWRWSFWDGYYDCEWRDRGWHHGRDWRDDRSPRYRFGSARNEAERLAAISGANRQPTVLRGDEWRLRQQGYGADGTRELGATRSEPGRARGFGAPVAPAGLYGATTSRDIERGAANELVRYERGPSRFRALPQSSPDVATSMPPDRRAPGSWAPKPGYDATRFERAKPLREDDPHAGARDARAYRDGPDHGYARPDRGTYAAPSRERVPRDYGAGQAAPPPAHRSQALPAYRAERAPSVGYTRDSGPSHAAPPPRADYAKPMGHSGGGWSGGKDGGGGRDGGSRDRDRDRDD